MSLALFNDKDCSFIKKTSYRFAGKRPQEITDRIMSKKSVEQHIRLLEHSVEKLTIKKRQNLMRDISVVFENHIVIARDTLKKAQRHLDDLYLVRATNQ